MPSPNIVFGDLTNNKTKNQNYGKQQTLFSVF